MRIKKSFLLVCLSTILVSACDKQKDKIETRLRTVKYQIIRAGTNGSSRTFPGLAKAHTEANLSFRVAGSIQSLPSKVGEHLQAGQVIASLDASQYELQAQQAKASLAQATAALRNARAAYERVKGLYENNNASRGDLDSSRANADSNAAQVRAARKALQLARLNITYTQLKTSYPCDIAEVNVSENENVSSGQSIVKVTCGNTLDVEVSVPGNYIATIKKNMPVTITFSILPGEVFSAIVSEVGVASISGGSTFPVTATLDEKPEHLRSGLAADVSFTFPINTSNTFFTVPAVAVNEDAQGRFVYIVEPDDSEDTGIVKRRSVSIGELTPNGLKIIEGLSVGDKVVTAGITVIRDKLKVRLN